MTIHPPLMHKIPRHMHVHGLWNIWATSLRKSHVTRILHLTCMRRIMLLAYTSSILHRVCIVEYIHTPSSMNSMVKPLECQTTPVRIIDCSSHNTMQLHICPHTRISVYTHKLIYIHIYPSIHDPNHGLIKNPQIMTKHHILHMQYMYRESLVLFV